MPPGHIAATWGVATLFQQNDPRPQQLDYRLLALSALAADLIDKPLALFVFNEAHTSQLIAHSLIPNLILLTITLVMWPKALPYVLAFAGHLLADTMWHHTESFWWPMFGWTTFWEYKFMNTPEAMLSVYLAILRYPQVWVIEILAVFFLIWFGYRYKLYRRSGLKRLILTGQIGLFQSRTLSKDGDEPARHAPIVKHKPVKS